MVQTYIRKTTRGVNGNWTSENLCLAFEAVQKNSSSINQASTNFSSDPDQHLLQVMEPSTTFVTPVVIKPIPVSHRVQQLSCRKRVSQGSVVAANSPFKNQVKLKESVKKAQVDKKNERAKKKLSKKVELGLSGEKKAALLTKKSKRFTEGNTLEKNKPQSNEAPCILDSGKQFNKELNQTEDESPCLCSYCGYVFGDEMDPLFEDDWLSCKKCYNWAHESCGTVIGSFTCYGCQSENLQSNTKSKRK